MFCLWQISAVDKHVFWCHFLVYDDYLSCCCFWKIKDSSFLIPDYGCSNTCTGDNQRKHRSCALLAFGSFYTGPPTWASSVRTGSVSMSWYHHLSDNPWITPQWAFALTSTNIYTRDFTHGVSWTKRCVQQCKFCSELRVPTTEPTLLLFFLWRCKELVHQQPWHWLISQKIFHCHQQDKLIFKFSIFNGNASVLLRTATQVTMSLSTQWY